MDVNSNKMRLPSTAFKFFAVVLLTVVLFAVILFTVIASSTFLLTRTSETDGLPEVVDFNEHIRPILSTNCYVCHGPDISTREAGLRLDLRDSAIVELESGNIAVIPENGAASELIRRVASSDPEKRMPPKKQKKILSSQEVSLLKKWIDQGAEWKEHWSLVPPQKPAIPGVRRSWQIENEIDRFIVAALEDKRLSPSSEASKTALIRRLSFVLTGLPPTPEGVTAFLEDDSPDAYEELVDRLLDSPHFGERWARHWMDVVRYANTRGHEFDYPVIGANQYRDYLIRAFNEDVPYDQLVTEHLAGDLVEMPRRHPRTGFNESAIGTVFYGLGEGKHSPVDTKIEEFERNDIIIDVTSKAFQGLTVSCTKCHDHKFDPIPATDYYALYGIIKSSRYAMRAANITDDIKMQVEQLKALRQAVREQVSKQWLEEVDEDTYEVTLTSTGGLPESDSAYQTIGDFSDGVYDDWRIDGLAFEQTPPVGRPVFNDGRLTEILSPRISSATLSTKLHGIVHSQDFELTHDYITVRAAGHEARIRVIMDNFQLIQNPIYGGLEAEIGTSAFQDYTFDLRMWKGKKMYLEFLPAKYKTHRFIQSDSSYIEALYAVAHNGEQPGFYQDKAQTKTLGSQQVKAAISNWQRGNANAEEIAVLNAILGGDKLSSSIAGVSELLEEIEALEKAMPEPEPYMGIIDGNGADHPVFIRGALAMPSEELVPRRGFTIHDRAQTPFETAGSGRMHFVEALLDPQNPLTSRVMVNRLWHHVFGRGLVETVDNFGVQGKFPSHPELLDYLAVHFVEDGWSIKRMLRMMVLSKTFRMSTTPSDKVQTVDPDNIYLQHYPVRRLEAEAIRDAMLVTSGRFDPTMFGEDIPIYLTEFMEGRGRPQESGPLDGAGRRSIYTSIRRNFLPPFMLVFDMPIPFTTFGKRNSSNVPAQSLTLLNDPFVWDQADHWAGKLITLKELGMEQKISQVYLRAFGRKPEAQEVDEALFFLHQQASTYSLNPDEILNDRRPWRDFCHTVFNMKEFIHLV